MENNPYDQFDTEDFVSLSPWLIYEMSELSNNAARLFTLLLKKIRRKRGSREPTRKSNPFHLSPKEFIDLGVPKENLVRGMEELVAKKFVTDKGSRDKRKCKILRW